MRDHPETEAAIVAVGALVARVGGDARATRQRPDRRHIPRPARGRRPAPIKRSVMEAVPQKQLAVADQLGLDAIEGGRQAVEAQGPPVADAAGDDDPTGKAAAGEPGAEASDPP